MFKLKIIFKITLLTFLLRKQLNTYCHAFYFYYHAAVRHLFSDTIRFPKISPRKIAGIIGNASRHFYEPVFGGMYPLKLFSYYTLCLWCPTGINAIDVTYGQCLYVHMWLLGHLYWRPGERNDDHVNVGKSYLP